MRVEHVSKIGLCLWFDDRAEEAADFYVSVFPNSKVTTITLTGADAAGGGSVGTAATASCFAFSESMEATQFLVIGRGTKLGIISLSTYLNVADGTAEGAGVPYTANVTDLFFTITAAG